MKPILVAVIAAACWAATRSARPRERVLAGNTLKSDQQTQVRKAMGRKKIPALWLAAASAATLVKTTPAQGMRAGSERGCRRG